MINTVHTVFKFVWLKVFVVQKKEYVTEKTSKSNEKKRGGKEAQKGKNMH